ncbi:hypothetical protein niasHT_030072 [Heterodera trifolii]|uniref:Aquaporin n=1 Tax=Heterodera trifolii TaxID=157864 RepID=A0ABD2JQL9_9BILA
MFDVNFVMDNYGLSGVFLEIVLIELVNAFLFQRAFADPCQLASSYASWLLSRQFFALNLHSQHINAFEEECSADLTVAILYGSIVEAFGLFAGKFADFCIEKRALSPTHANVINAICSGTITILGINISGMYANPIVAWALTFNCKGISHLGHISVYWLAPICAFFATKTVFGDENDQQQEEAEKSFDETGKLANPTNGNGTKKVN